MIRALLYALISIVVITFIRMVAGIVMRSVGDAFKEEASAAGTASGQPRGSSQAHGSQAHGSSQPRSSGAGPVPTSGELKACQQCGTYVLASAAKTLTDSGKTSYYCSDECRKKAQG